MTKIGIVHDFFDMNMLGGGETEMKMLAEGLKSRGYDVMMFCGYNNGFKMDVPIKEVGCYCKQPILKQTELAYRFSKLDLKDFDVVISENYWTSFINHPNHIHHCEAPIRQFYDLRGFWSNQLPIYMRIPFNIWIDMMIPFEQKAIRKCRLVANSEFTKTRIQMYYNMNSTVVYPPVITKNYKYQDNGDFWLYIGRLDYNKRIELMIEAFKRTGKQLIVYGSGLLLEKAREMTKEYPNIWIMGYGEDNEIISAYENCLATVYIPMFEDFGQVPIEGMAAGKPCLGVPEGGLLETIIPNKTGWLVYPRLDDLIKKVKSISPEECKKMKDNCIKQAKKFDIEKYLDQWEKIL